MHLVCKCGHPESAHDRFTERNTIGQSFHNQCAAGWKDIRPYLVAGPGACQCSNYRPCWWRPVFGEKEE